MQPCIPSHIRTARLPTCTKTHMQGRGLLFLPWSLRLTTPWRCWCQATTEERPHYMEQPRPRRLKPSPHTRRQQSGTGREMLPQHGRCHLPPTLSGQDDSGRQIPICDSLQYQGRGDISQTRGSTGVLSRVNQWDCARQRHSAPELKSLYISAVNHSHPLLPTTPTREHSPPPQ